MRRRVGAVRLFDEHSDTVVPLPCFVNLVQHVAGDPADGAVRFGVKQDGPVVVLLVGFISQQKLVAMRERREQLIVPW